MSRSDVPNSPWADLNFFIEHQGMGNRELARTYGGSESNWRRWRAKHGLAPSEATSSAIQESHSDVLESSGDPKSFVEVIEYRSDSGYRSDKLLKISREDCMDNEFLLRAHGFNPNVWMVDKATNNIWSVFSKDPIDGSHNISTLYASRLIVKPIVKGFDVDKIIERLKSVTPIYVAARAVGAAAQRMLELPFFDMHIGLSKFDLYKETLAEAVELIRSRHWEKIVIPVGSDLFHHDNFKGTTSNGTVVEGMDWAEAYADATKFFGVLIPEALQNANEVEVIYVKGNHDESMAWAYVHYLSALYPEATYDLDKVERKVTRFHDVTIGYCHGDKKMTDIDRIFMSEFPGFATAGIKEIHSGHFHHEVAKDQYGIVIRGLCTRNKTDNWHHDKGFVGANKRFQVFEYGTDYLSSIRYI